jgi:hypothetical protein
MIISKNTIEVLKNFSQYNDGLYVKAGSKLSTIAFKTKAVLIEYTAEEKFEKPFAIYKLNTFLSVLSSSGDSPDIDFDETEMTIKGFNGKSKTRYRYCDPSNIQIAPEGKTLEITPDVEFDLSQRDFEKALNFASVLELPNLSFYNDGDELFAYANDPKNDSAHTTSIFLCKLPDKGEQFSFTFKVNNFMFIPGDYNVKISRNGIAKFSHKTKELVYWVCVEQQGSSFTKG